MALVRASSSVTAVNAEQRFPIIAVVPITGTRGKLQLPCSIAELFPQAARDLLARQLEIDLTSVARVAELPQHHRHPFDRLIIAQALLHECTVVTSNTQFAAYGVNVLW